MLKTISAALLAMSVIAAPALAANSSKATATPTTKTAELKTGEKANVKTGALNAYAKVGKHHRKHISHLRHKHKQMNAAKTHATKHAKAQTKVSPKVSLKQANSSSKRG